ITPIEAAENVAKKRITACVIVGWFCFREIRISLLFSFRKVSEPEFNVCYWFLLLKILFFVESLYTGHFLRRIFVAIHIVVRIEYFASQSMQQAQGIAVHEFAVCLEVNNPVFL